MSDSRAAKLEGVEFMRERTRLLDKLADLHEEHKRLYEEIDAVEGRMEEVRAELAGMGVERP